MRKGSICIYTDDSCIESHAGSAAVYLEKEQMRNAYIGTGATSTLYAAQLQGIDIAPMIAKA
jgi:hypothetical protein